MNFKLRAPLLAEAAIVVVSTLILGFLAPAQIPAFLAGCFLVSLNFVLLNMLWRRIFDKKSVASTFVLIVIKYSILGALLYFFVIKMRLALLPFLAGVATLGGSFLIVAFQKQIEKHR